MDFWTADRIETLRMMRASGATARAIGEAIGCSRNAVLGKLDRIGMNTAAVPRTWTPERVETLKALHAAGKMYSEIAEVLGVTPKAARNYAEKIKLPRRESGSHFNPARVRSAPRAPRAFKPRLVDMTAPSLDLAVGILDVTGCKWAVGENEATPGRHLFCNHATEENAAYCPYHSALNVARPVPVAQRKRFIIPTTLLRAVA